MKIENFEELLNRHFSNDAGFCRHYLTLYSFVFGMEAKSVFEFGSGFSTKTILMALDETKGKLITCDQRPLDQTAIFYDKRDVERHSNWRYINKRSSLIKEDIKNEVFDLVLHDGAHDSKTVIEDMRLIIPKMKVDGLFLLHDTEHRDYDLKKALNIDWCKVSQVTLPFGYGLSIIRIEEDFGHGNVELNWQKVR